MAGDDIQDWQWDAPYRTPWRAMDDRTVALFEGLVGALESCRATLAMYAHRDDIPALKGADFWLREARFALASAIDARSAKTEGLGPKDESATRAAGDAQ